MTVSYVSDKFICSFYPEVDQPASIYTEEVHEKWRSQSANESCNEIIGIVEIPSPPKGVPLMLKVTLSVPVPLSQTNLGRLELVKSKRESVQEISQGRSLFYKIQFPLQKPLPILTGISLNNQQYCIGPRATGAIVSFIYLEHTLYPPGIIPFSKVQNNQSDLSRPSESLITTTVIPKSKNDFGHNFGGLSDGTYLEKNCGIAKNSNPLVTRGKKTYPGEWPWLVAIFFAEVDLEYQCVGNLVSRKHIITVAHCLKRYEISVPPNVILVSLGKYLLEDWDKTGILNREVSEIRMHPDFRDSMSADADLSILVLNKPVDYNFDIKPICLWKGPSELEKIVGEMGYVVGWGRADRERISEGEPRMTIAPIVSQEDCLRSNAAFIEMTSKRTFCAGNRNGTDPCNGDSGSGFVIFNSKTGRYHLRGIVSLSLLDKKTMSCDLNEYIVYVDLAKHHDWILKQISSYTV
ncbi:serine protease gd-like [Belonocnema kinseyi]|uniref:serine protease gd-like n=1 Tax=Belonocnema kinseyi TaxID=2817044 RepID=UPI00143CC145|nr:serine protease gd-like [Belonocnema kinseyi]